MRRAFVVFGVSLAILALPMVALGAKPAWTCPAGASGFERVDRDGWWDRTVQGFAEEGIAVYEADGETFTAEFDSFAADFGLVDGAGLEDFVRVTQWPIIDKNDNGHVCMKDMPNTKGMPGYLVTGVDDQASVPGR